MFFSFGHTFRDYPWHHHDKQRKVGAPEHECYAHSWKYLILITLAKVLLNHDNSQPWDDYSQSALSSIETFVLDTYGSRDPDVSQVFQPSTKLKLNASIGFKLGVVEAKAAPTEVPMEYLPTVVQEVNANLLEKIVRSLNPQNQYFVLFDELDLGFSLADENYRLRLIGLIHAARDINVAARDATKNLNVIVFLREDIYQSLQFEDKNKITESGTTRIEWDTPRTSHTLREIMAKRISNVLAVPTISAWDSVFNEEHRMRGSQSKYQHMLDRTMLRPRDIIKFSNEILGAYKRNASRTEKFENVDVASARPEYSQYLLSELEDEIFKHLPYHDSFFELLRDLEAVQFSYEEFDGICKQRQDLIPEGHTAKSILSELFEFSIIGYYQPGGAGYGGAEYVFRYKSPRAKFNSSATGYQVHLGLQEVLALKRYRRGGGDEEERD
jgi:hypothetical protein